ncbi:hypothetical protein SLA2020_321710 [Shorea laevis]
MAAFSNSVALTRNPRIHLSCGSSLKLEDQSLRGACPANLSFNSNRPGKVQLATSRRSLTVQAAYRNDGRPSSASIFVGGFVLGGVIVGALGCVFASQISNALAGVDRRELMRKLPKFIYDEEKALERKRKILSEKIDQLNLAIDEISAQIRSEDAPNGVAVNSNGVEATV